MAFLRRSRRTPDPTAAIASFWQWWTAEGADRTTRALAAQSPDRMTYSLTTKVGEIHPDLAWELAAGADAEHQLVVTAEGDAELRAVARRWLRSAPAADATWEYADLRQPVADLEGMTLGIADERIGFADVVVAARRDGHRLDVALHHPSFGVLPEGVRNQVAFLALDSTLGEAGTELWIGDVAVLETPPLDGFGLAGLRVAVQDVRATTLDSDGHPVWVVLSGESEDGPVLAVTQVLLSPLLAPQLDQYVSVVVPYTDRTPEGFPGPDSIDELRRLEDHLTERLGGSGRLVAHQSQAGVRTVHAYVDSTTPAAEQVRAAVSGWTQGTVVVSAAPDPSWSAVSHLRT